MILRNFLSVACLSLSSSLLLAQPGHTDYDAGWKLVDSLINKKGLPKSALEEVNILYEAAKKERNDAQYIRALIFRMGLKEGTSDEGADKNSMPELEKEALTARQPASSILLSLLARDYLYYFRYNRWKLYNRTQTKNFTKEGIASWGPEDFHKKIGSLYLASLEEKTLLQKTGLGSFDPILTKGTTPGLRPTLFDLLAHEALDYFKGDEQDLNKPAYAFEISDPAVFADAFSFANHGFHTDDTLSLHFRALQLFQELTRMHLADASPLALLDLDIERIRFAYQYGVMENKTELYMKVLTALTDRFPDEPVTAEAWYLQAQEWTQKGNRYRPLGDTTDRFAYLQAKAICDKVIAETENSEGQENCQTLLHSILHKELRLQTENVNLPGQPFRSLLTWRNFSAAYFRLVRVDADMKKRLGYNPWEKNYWQKLIGEPVFKTFSQTLPETGDHQMHSTEIRIDALTPGAYALVASSRADFSVDTNALAAQYFYVSSIAYIRNDHDFFVLNRESGHPLAGATVQIWTQNYDLKTKRLVSDRAESYQTDAQGHFYWKETADGNRRIGQLIEISIPGDHLFTDDDHRNNFRDETVETNADKEYYERKNRRTFFFTDRSIYRPGQTVFFKGILTTRDFDTRHSKILAQFSTKVTLYNVNTEKIDSVLVTSNAFGSFHGSFHLPEHQLNGMYHIADDSTDDNQNFSVEEYKRPKFYVDYQRLKGSYRVGDSIRVRGSARAYAGNNIDGATVKYRILRQARFPDRWLFWRGGGRSSVEQEIAHGETRTGADGSFTLSFLALPDQTVSRDLDPVFNYKITADITDINGETRNGVITVPVGYKILSLAIRLPEGDRLPADSLRTLSVKSTNLSGEPVAASVNLNIYKLKAPERLIRQRYWEEPDQFVMSPSTYLSYFPHDEYSDETKKEGWERTDEIFHSTGSPDSTEQTYNLQGIKFTAGWWLVEAETKDKYGQEVETRQYVELYDAATGQPSHQEYEWFPYQTQIVEPGSEATIANGSSAADIFVIRKIDRNSEEKQGAGSRLSFYTLNKEKKSFTFPVTESDRGGLQIEDAFVKDNRYYLSGHRVNVPWTNKELKISYTSYRDKTLPGSEEKWQVKISGYKGDKVAAEVLAGMYDASLDQFKPHNWFRPELYTSYQSWAGWNFMNNFYAPRSIEKFQDNPAVKAYFKLYDQLMPNLNDFDKAPFRGNKYKDVTGGVPSLSEAVVIGYGTQRRTDLANVQIRGTAGLHRDADGTLYVIDGVIGTDASLAGISADDIQSLQVLKGAEATALYGAQAANGIVVVTTKRGALKNEQQEGQIRKNFNETAFFFPDLQTDSAGNASFSFTMPEALTRWRWMTLAHTKDLAFGYSERSVITQKQLMVQPNAPRFFREGDRMELSARIVNLSGSALPVQVELQLTDPTNNQLVDGALGNLQPHRSLSLPAGSSGSVSFPIEIPDNYGRPLTYRIVAHAVGSGNEISDGEQSTLPVLSNRMLVTESLPLNMRGDGTRHFAFDKLLQSGASPTLRQHALTVEFSSNPAWYAVQALPYLMEYPYECAEQTFDRFYANSLATLIVNSAPRVKAVFEQWKTADTAALMSNLQKNQELKSVLLEETPWVLEGKSESQRKKKIALLFDMTRMSLELGSALTQLQNMQSPDGGFAWFKGGPEDRYITQYILTGIGHLQKLNALPAEAAARLRAMVDRALSYLDEKIIEDYEGLKKSFADMKDEMGKNIQIEAITAGPVQVQYLYMRSFFADRGIPGGVFPALNVFRKQTQLSWPRVSKYMQGMIALALYRTGDVQTARDIIASLRQNAIRDTSDADKGMYWPGMKGGFYWYQAPVEIQSLLIEAFQEISPDAGIDRDLKTWLLRQKQTHNWPTTKATADACYALLMTGRSWLQEERRVDITLGDKTISSSGGGAGMGYFKKVFDGSQVEPPMGNITVSLGSSEPSKPAVRISPPAWGAVYWQYFENLDKIVPPADHPVVLRLTKKLFVERNGDRGPVLEPVGEKDTLRPGDKVRIRIELTADRDLEYVHMKDMRASCMEPVNVLSQYKWQGGLGYYESTKDAATDFFFSWLPKGTWVFEYPVFVGQAGNFSNGVTSIECMYAPEFSFHSEGVRVNVKAAAP